MGSKSRPLVGRAATPAPPNVGASSLGTAVRLATAPRFTREEYILTVTSPRLFARLERQVGPVFPAVPGLAGEALEKLTVRCLVVEETALSRGVWTGVLEKHGADLSSELVELFERTRAAGVPAYWVRDSSCSVRTVHDGDSEQQETAGLPGLPFPQAMLVSPESPMGAGSVEGARPTRLVSVLREAACDPS